MNVHAVPQLTPAETALIESFAARISDLPGNAEVTAHRDNAIEQVKMGLPTRRVEAWHYTDLRRLLAKVPAFDAAAKPDALRALLPGSTVLRVHNGKAETPSAIEGMTVETARLALAGGRIALSAADVDDTIGTINGAFVSDGFSITVEAGRSIESPVELHNLQAGGQVHSRFPVSVGAGASVTFIERQTGSGDALVSSVTSLEVGDGADVRWLILQEQPGGATHLGQINVSIGKDAKLTLFVLNTGGKLVRQEIRVVAAGEGAEFTLRGVNLLAGDTHCDVTMVLDHAEPHSTSTEVIRNVVTDKAHGVFQGRINVHQKAQKTDAKMACNTLLLSDDAEFSTKPELEIFADDVACGHGATITEIDRGQLFYLMARGIDEKIARGLLVKAFVAEIIEELDDEPLVEALMAKLDAWFAQHG
jgi:Fe-S cluster assembly protein SufD